jgi:hypothetical protein
VSAVRVRRIASIVAATLVLLGIPGGLTARGAESTGLYGFGMGATASAISFLYNQPSFGVPTDPTFELRKVYSASDLDSGPTGHGIGSVLWPGQVVGNAPPSLLFDTVLFNPTQFEQLQPIIDQIKKGGSDATAGRSGYPIRAESFYPQGPPSSSNDLATGRMGSSAEVDQTDGSSSTGGAGLPGIIQYGSLFSHSNTRVLNGQAVATSVAKVTDLDLFGAIHIDSFVATVKSTSDGQKAKNEGTFAIAGMTIKDQAGKEQAKIVLDQTGFHFGDQNQDPLGTLADQVFKKYLEPQGIDLFAGKPIDSLDGATASRSLAGLVLHIDARGMKELQQRLKDNGLSDVVGTLRNPTSNHALDPLFGDNGVLSPTIAGFIGSFFQGDQTMDVVFGSLAVSAAASPPFDDSILPPIDIPPVTGVPFTPGTGGFDAGAFVPPTTPQAGGGFLNLEPVAVKGIPFAFIAFVLALGLFGSTRLRLFADRVMATRAAVRCPLEEADR